jgi:hypothetical protein
VVKILSGLTAKPDGMPELKIFETLRGTLEIFKFFGSQIENATSDGGKLYLTL